MIGRSERVAAVALSAALMLAAAAAPAATRNAGAARDAGSNGTAALAGSGVPVLLPAHVPAALGAPPLHLTVVDADRSGYYVALSPDAACGGGLSCSTLHVAGYRAREEPASRSDRTVVLADGARGIYTPRDCSGAGCSEASLRFERSGVTYEIDAKVGPDGLGPLRAVYATLERWKPPHELQRKRD